MALAMIGLLLVFYFMWRWSKANAIANEKKSIDNQGSLLPSSSILNDASIPNPIVNEPSPDLLKPDISLETSFSAPSANLHPTEPPASMEAKDDKAQRRADREARRLRREMRERRHDGQASDNDEGLCFNPFVRD